MGCGVLIVERPIGIQGFKGVLDDERFLHVYMFPCPRPPGHLIRAPVLSLAARLPKGDLPVFNPPHHICNMNHDVLTIQCLCTYMYVWL